MRSFYPDGLLIYSVACLQICKSCCIRTGYNVQFGDLLLYLKEVIVLPFVNFSLTLSFGHHQVNTVTLNRFHSYLCNELMKEGVMVRQMSNYKIRCGLCSFVFFLLLSISHFFGVQERRSFRFRLYRKTLYGFSCQTVLTCSMIRNKKKMLY